MKVMETERMVEAIEEGKIVRVTEDYAKREGLIVLKRYDPPAAAPTAPGYNISKKAEPVKSMRDYLEKRPDWREKQVTSELLENFNWVVRNERRRRGLTRKQLAKMINEPEENIKMVEAGYLPAKDFILVNKIQGVFGVSLRKDQKKFDSPVMPSVLQNPPSTLSQPAPRSERTFADIKAKHDKTPPRDIRPPRKDYRNVKNKINDDAEIEIIDFGDD